MQNVSPTVSLLIACLQLSLEAINRKQFEVHCNKKIDWDIFNNLTKFHKVQSLVHNQFSHHSKAYFPENTMTLLENDHRYNAASSLLLSSELIKITRTFEEINLPVLLIKGLSVSNWLYEKPSLRSSGDIDLLINSDSWEMALSCMESIGYKMSPIRDRLVKGSQLSKQFINTQKDTVFVHEQNNVIVEMHWRFSSNYDVFPLSFDKAWKARTEFDIRSTSIQQLSPEMHALYLCYHGSKHGWDKLFWLYDIALLLLDERTDWKEICKIARKVNATASLGLALVLASRTFLVEIPETVKREGDMMKLGKQLSDEIFLKILTDNPIETSAGILSKCKEIKWGSHISPLKSPYFNGWLHFLTLPGVDDWESIILPDNLTHLYRLLRPFRLVLKVFFGVKS